MLFEDIFSRSNMILVDKKNITLHNFIFLNDVPSPHDFLRQRVKNYKRHNEPDYNDMFTGSLAGKVYVLLLTIKTTSLFVSFV